MTSRGMMGGASLAAAFLLAVGPSSARAQADCAGAIEACSARLPAACLDGRLGAGVLAANGSECRALLRGYSSCLGAVVAECRRPPAAADDPARDAEARAAFRHAAGQGLEAAFRDVAELYPDTYWGRQAAREAARLGPAAAVRLAASAPMTPGRRFRDCVGCPEMAAAPAGAFVMGSPGEETGRLAGEGPQRRVEIAPFALGVFEVTFEEWDRCVAAGACAHRPDDRGWGRGRQPVINVSWDDAQAYAGWLSDITGRVYRLPSEAEWEYAARAGAETAYSWGPGYRNGAAADGGRAEPVGSYPANALGLHDMHGNVHEWVADCWRADHRGAPSDGSPRIDAPHGAAAGCAVATLKGGAWGMAPRHLRAAARQSERRGRRSADVGFRVARDF